MATLKAEKDKGRDTTMGEWPCMLDLRRLLPARTQNGVQTALTGFVKLK